MIAIVIATIVRRGLVRRRTQRVGVNATIQIHLRPPAIAGETHVRKYWGRDRAAISPAHLAPPPAFGVVVKPRDGHRAALMAVRALGVSVEGWGKDVVSLHRNQAGKEILKS